MTVHTLYVPRVGSATNDFPRSNSNANDAPSKMSDDTPSRDTEAARVSADARLKQNSAQLSAGMRMPVPSESTMGQWLEALNSLINSSAFKRLESHFGGLGALTHIDPYKGEIWFDGGKIKINADAPDINGIPGGEALFDSLMVIAKRFAPDVRLSRHDVFKPDASGQNTVESNAVQQFYGSEPRALPDNHVPANILSKTGEAETRHNMLAALKKQIEAPGAKPDLESIVVAIAPHSVLWNAEQAQPITMNLKQLLNAYGLQTPTTPEALANLELALFAAPLSAPAEANYGGLLSKPLPMGEDAQKKIVETVSTWKAQQTQVPAAREGHVPNLFRYLDRALPQAMRELADTDPGAFLKALINTPQARALGEQLQEAIGALPSQNSGQEALLAALALEADPAAGSQRDNLNGYNLRQQDNLGRSPAQIVERFEEHLEGRVGRNMARVAAYQLLAMSAPEFLVKDVPHTLVYGSQQWANFSAAVSRREQDTPGSSAGSTYAEIMQRNSLDPVTDAGHNQAQRAAMTSVIDWGIANGVIEESKDGNYSPEAIERISAAMQKQVDGLAASLSAMTAPIPTRRELALAELTRVFGQGYAPLFEEKNLSLALGAFGDGPKYSLLEIYMSGDHHRQTVRPIGVNYPVDVLREGIAKLPDIKQEFEDEFAKYSEGSSKAVAAMFQHHLALLPPEDRKRFEQGRIVSNYFSPKTDSSFPKASDQPAVRFFENGAVLFDTHLDGTLVKYVYSPAMGKIAKLDDPMLKGTKAWNLVDTSHVHRGPLEHARRGLKVGDDIYPLRMGFVSSGAVHEPPAAAQPGHRADELNKMVSAYYSDMANAFKSSAKGVTRLEKEAAQMKFWQNFIVGLIPFHDVIKHATEGNKQDAVVSGLLDFLGLVVPGVKGGYAGAKIGAKGIGSVSGFIKGFTKAGIKAANPLGSIYDAGKGVFKLGKTVVRSLPSVEVSLFDKVRHLGGRSGSWDIPQGGYKQTIADGTYRPLGEKGTEFSVLAANRNGKWYALDPKTMAPYGTELKDFTPVSPQALRDLRQDSGVSIKDGSSFSESQQEHQGIQANPGTVPTPSPQEKEQSRETASLARNTTKLVQSAQA
ncbi:MAG: hypothetical protein WBB95_26320 [Pseudomonas sp.]|uniref:hypothetical protein n=1 Tax=Pseudomonas sp. TaxID=306 RepID=UPI003C70921E